MKSTNKIISSFVFVALFSQSTCLFAQDTSAPSFWQDVKAYKRCRGTRQGCSPELTARLKRKALYGVGVLAVVAATILGIAGIAVGTSRRGSGEQEHLSAVADVVEAIKEFKIADQNDLFLLDSAAHGNINQVLQMPVYNFSKNAFIAAISIAEQNGMDEIVNMLRSKLAGADAVLLDIAQRGVDAELENALNARALPFYSPEVLRAVFEKRIKDGNFAIGFKALLSIYL